MNPASDRLPALIVLAGLLVTAGCYDPYGLRLAATDWDVHRTPHVCFYEQRTSGRTDEDVRLDLDLLEEQYRRLADLLAFEPTNAVHCYRYADLEEMRKLLGWGTGWSGGTCYSQGVSEIHFAGDGRTLRHELTHVFGHELRDSNASGFLSEGFAVCYERPGENTLVHDYCRHLLQVDGLAPLDNILTRYDIQADSDAYRRAGSFVEYLIGAYGIERFKQFYRRTANTSFEPDHHILVTSKETYGRSLDKLETDWRRFLLAWSEEPEESPACALAASD